MNRIISTLTLVFATIVSFTSCSLDNDDYPTILPPEPPEFYFVFDEEGVPVPSGWDNKLSDEMQKLFREQVIGHGWEWMQTLEIKENGRTKTTDYYKNLLGAGPSQYYFKSESEVVEYFFSDAKPGYCYCNQPILADAETGRIIFNPDDSEHRRNKLDIFSIYNHQGTWIIAATELLAYQYDEKGELRPVWGLSNYKQMPSKRLKEIQEQFSVNFKDN